MTDQPPLGDSPRHRSFHEQAAAGDDDAAWAARLLSTVRIEDPGPVARRRVWSALERRRAPRTGPWVVGLALRPAVVMAVLFGLVAVAGATLGRPALRRWRAATSEVVLPVERPAGHPAASSAVAPSGPVATTVRPAPPISAATTIANSPALAPGAFPVPSRPPGALVSDPVGAGRDAADPEVSLVVDAVNALRRDHRPERASSLLATYRERYPRGVLAEEALVLAVEAATAAHDNASAATLGAAYLAHHPAGRFADVARAAVAASAR